MKKKNLLLTAVATIGLAAASMAQTVPNYVPTNGLVGWWPFNGNANDESGNGNNGTVNGATLTTDRFGNANKAYNYNGINDFIEVPHSNSICVTNDYSISVWIKISNYSFSNLSDKSSVVIGKAYIDDWASGYNIFAVEGNYNNKFGGNNLLSSTQTPINQWIQIVYTYDGNIIKLYLNGTLNNSYNFQFNLQYGAPTSLFFGKEFNNTWSNRYFNGSADDIGIWDRALSQQEITALYTNCDLNVTITPASAFVSTGANAQFSSSAADPNSTFQWQSNADNFGWLNVPTNNFYSGTTTNTLLVNNVQLGNHNQPFRVIATAGNCVDTSATVYVQIADTCVNTVIDTNYVNQTIYDTTHVTVTDTNYVTVYDTVTTYISVTDTLFIAINTVGLNNNPVVNTIKVFPNPSNSILNLNYGNYATLNNYRVKITNALGQTIYDQAIAQQSEVLDLSTFGGNGIYYLSILNPQGNVIEVRKIVLQ